MKIQNSLFLVFVILICCNSWSQDYKVKYESETYTPLTTFMEVDESDPEINSAGKELYGKIPIGFSFEIDGEAFDSLFISENGYVRFKSLGVNRSFISMFECSLEDLNNIPSKSPIRYQTTGSSGSKVFTCEFLNKGFVNDAEKNDSVSFQLRLYQQCDDFEVLIGTQSIESSETDLFFSHIYKAPFIGYGNDNTYELSGDYNSPILLPTNGNSLSSIPPSGSVYKFTKCTVGISEVNSLDFSIIPNPTNGIVILRTNGQSQIQRVEILNIQGQIIKNYSIPNTKTLTIDISEFNSGIYIIKAYSNNAVLAKRIVKE